jgi:hypothetical protein
MITNIQACGHMVKITSDFRGDELINRREALLRIDGLLGMDGSTRMADMLETLVKAVNQARINETGSGYSHRALEALLAKIRNGREEARLRDKKVAAPDLAPCGGTRIASSDGGTRSMPPADLPETPAVHETTDASHTSATPP